MYFQPELTADLSQGDIVVDCPILAWNLDATDVSTRQSREYSVTVIVMSQACDLAQGKSDRVVVAVVHRAQRLVELGTLKPAQIRDQIRLHRIFGWYFLPANGEFPESLVDLRDLHTVPRKLLEQLIADGKRACRLVTPYREHLAQQFATTYARIALPEPYGTEVTD